MVGKDIPCASKLSSYWKKAALTQPACSDVNPTRLSHGFFLRFAGTWFANRLLFSGVEIGAYHRIEPIVTLGVCQQDEQVCTGVNKAFHSPSNTSLQCSLSESWETVQCLKNTYSPYLKKRINTV